MAAPKSKMTDDHKAALAAGRAEGRAVRAYLEAIEQNRPRRGRRRTPDSINARLGKIDTELVSADPMSRLLLVQERLDLLAELDSMSQTVDLTELEAAFVRSAKGYGDRKGISYAAWREVGVSAATLKAAGIQRGA
ncbi:MAG: hypothetical protein ACKOYM_11950 [Actinomycetes bacterium]